MLVTNLSHQQDDNLSELSGRILPMNILSLQGKVETEINVALGYLQVRILSLYIVNATNVHHVLLTVMFLLILTLRCVSLNH